MEKSFNLCQTNRNRKIAAFGNLETAEAAYKKGEATLELLLDAQRHAAESEIAYAQSLYDLKHSGPTAADSASKLARVKLDALTKARDRALQTWREIKAEVDKDTHVGESEKEAQAREQYFLFRGQVEESLKELNSVQAREKQERSGLESDKPEIDTNDRYEKRRPYRS